MARLAGSPMIGRRENGSRGYPAARATRDPALTTSCGPAPAASRKRPGCPGRSAFGGVRAEHPRRAAREATAPQAVAEELGERAHAATFAEAVAPAEAVLVAVPRPAVVRVLGPCKLVWARQGGAEGGMPAQATAGTNGLGRP